MQQIIFKLISENQVIMLDTSVAMDANFRNLVDTIEVPLLENRKKIVVKSAVWAELLRHLSSNDQVKQLRATRAVEIISMHQNIFEIRDNDVDSKKILRAFADAEFLAELMLHKNHYTQALLTNDLKLSRDVNKLNEQESCLGKQISVYNLSRSGNIVYCSYEPEEMVDEINEVTEPKIIIKKIPVESNNVAQIVSGSVAALVVGVIVGKYGDKIIKVLKNVA